MPVYTNVLVSEEWYSFFSVVKSMGGWCPSRPGAEISAIPVPTDEAEYKRLGALVESLGSVDAIASFDQRSDS